MKNKSLILNFQIISTIFSMILGTLLHFTYNWSNNNLLVGVFSAVNESTWEHLKLLFFPMLITTILGYFYIGNNIPNFLIKTNYGYKKFSINNGKIGVTEADCPDKTCINMGFTDNVQSFFAEKR